MCIQSCVLADSVIDYGFDAKGGFYAIDHTAKVAAYAYPTSPHAVAAKRCPGRVIGRMLDEESVGVSDEIRLEHYATVYRSAQGSKGGAS